VHSPLAGYEVDDAARLSADPTFRLIGSPKRWEQSAALTSTLHWFETELLTREKHLPGLMASNRNLLAQTEFQDHPDRVVLDMDSSESLVHGQQERGRAFLGARSRYVRTRSRAAARPQLSRENRRRSIPSVLRGKRVTSVHRVRVSRPHSPRPRGRVAGPSGAAAKLGIPLSTLDRRIKALNIDKKRFRFR